MALSLDEARLLPRFRGRNPTRIVAALDAPAGAMQPGRVLKAEPGELRGLPVVASGVAGVQPGTNPEAALLAKERRRR